MPSQLQWKPGYKGMLACTHAHFWNLPQLVSLTQGFMPSWEGRYMDVGIKVVLVQPSGRGFC